MTVNIAQVVPGAGGIYRPSQHYHELWTPPSSEHAWSDEFDATTWHGLNSKWSRWDSWDDVNAIDPYWQGASGGGRWSLIRRPGWLQFQPHATGGTSIGQIQTIPTNCAWLIRSAFTSAYNTAGKTLDFALWNSDWSKGAQACRSRYWEGNVQIKWFRLDGGWGEVGATADVKTYGQPLQYLWIQKRNLTYDVWVGCDQGQWVWLNSYTFGSFTPDHFGWTGFNAAATAPGNQINSIDFVRVYEVADFWP
jgi:hypothetical protein